MCAKRAAIRANPRIFGRKALFRLCPFYTHPKALILSTVPKLKLQGKNGAPYYYFITSIPDGGDGGSFEGGGSVGLA
jgi:hypothetical protein